MVVYEIPSGGVGPATIFGNVNGGLGSPAFGSRFTIASTNVGGFDPIPPQPVRTIDAEAEPAWDRSGGAHNGRVYVVFTDAAAPRNGNTDIFVQFSDNNGATWSPRVRVDDDAGTNSQFLPWIAVDQTSGNVAVTWHDARNSPTDTREQYFGSVSFDNGATFKPNVVIGTGLSDCRQVTSGNGIECGDYSCMAFDHRRIHSAWADNSNSTGDNPDGTLHQLDIYTARAVVNQVPVAKCKNVTVSAGPACTASASVDNGSLDPDGDSITLTQTPPGPYGLGPNPVTLKVTDVFGGSSTCTATVTVVDTTPPVVTCPGPTTESADNSCKAPIPNVLPGVTITDNCPGPFSESQTPTTGTLVGLGTTTITVNVKDASGNPASCTTSLKVVDTTPPVVTSSVQTPLLWPPNHELVNVGLAASATDNCTPNPTLAVQGIVSTEPDVGPGSDANFSPDAANIGLGTLRLRSERDDGGNGRIYLDVVKATDGSGNVGFGCTAVVVPADQSPSAVAAANAAGATAQAFCNANKGAVPPGFVPVGVGPVIGPKQ